MSDDIHNFDLDISVVDIDTNIDVSANIPIVLSFPYIETDINDTSEYSFVIDNGGNVDFLVDISNESISNNVPFILKRTGTIPYEIYLVIYDKYLQVNYNEDDNNFMPNDFINSDDSIQYNEIYIPYGKQHMI